MKEFIDKLIRMLEEEKQRLRKLKNDTIALCDSEVIAIEEGAYNFCKKIINELAEEYKDNYVSVGVLKQIMWERDIAIEQLHELGYEFGEKIAEEYKDKVMIDGQYCWQTCSATEHCKECNRLCNGSIDCYENYDFMAEEYKGGWIPCSERLPK